MEKKCAICGFNKRVEIHHIIKLNDYGSNNEDNLVYLCPNHHWIADFGTEEDKNEIFQLLKQVYQKSGSTIFKEKIDQLEMKNRILNEKYLGKFTDEQWDKFKETYNYEETKNRLIGRNIDKKYTLGLNKKAEIMILIEKLNKELENIKI